MKILEKIIEENLRIAQSSVDEIEYIVVNRDTIKALSSQFREMYETDPTLEDLQELAGAKLLIPVIGDIYDEYQFLKRIKSYN